MDVFERVLVCSADTAGGTAAGQTDGHNNVESQTQPENSAETVLPQVRAKRLTRAERPQYLDNEDFEEEVWLVLDMHGMFSATTCYITNVYLVRLTLLKCVLVACIPQLASFVQLKESSILVEPDIPIYDLRQVLQKVGLPLEPQTPLFEKLQVCLDQADYSRSCPTVHVLSAHFITGFMYICFCSYTESSRAGLHLVCDLQKMSPAEVEDLLNTDKEEVAPFEGARRILNWEQRIVSVFTQLVAEQNTYGLSLLLVPGHDVCVVLGQDKIW